jgi:hypothetical protein
MFGDFATLNGRPAANGQATVNPPPAPAKALDRAPSGDRQQTASNGRDGSGRFAKGNRAGKGNPYSKQVAALRSELVNALTRKDIRRLARSLLKQAMKGSIPAVKLLLTYCVGQPVQIPPTADGLEDGEGLPGEEIGMPSNSMSELLDKIDQQFCQGDKPGSADRTLEKRFGAAWADVDRQIDAWQEEERLRKAARAAKRK